MRTRAAQKDVWESAFLTFFRHSHTQPGGGGRWGGRLRRARIRAFLLLIFCYFIALTCCNRKWCPQPPAGTSRLLCAGSALASALSVCQFISPPGHPVRRATSFLLLYWDARRRARTWPRPSESRLSLPFFFFLTLECFPLFWDLSVGLMWIFHFVWCVSIYKLCFSHLLCFTLSLFPLKIKKMTVKSLFHVLR